MGIAEGIFAAFSIVSSLSAGQQQQAAGAKARSAADQNALAIEDETARNITQMRRTQSQTLGMSKAIIASSGIRFDARKINRLRFSEGGTKEERTLVGRLGEGGQRFGVNDKRGTGQEIYENRTVEQAYGEQIDGDTEGSSAFQYLREMRRNFASDIGFMGKAGRSRAQVTRMGGQVAQAQANANATASYASAVGKFGSLFPSTPKPTTKPKPKPKLDTVGKY